MMKRILALLTAALLLVPAIPLAASAYGYDDDKLIVTHVNYDATAEGTATIYTPSCCKKLGEKGNFSWCVVIVFEWDAAKKCYTVKSVDDGMNKDKSNTAVPENGFVYAINRGNNWPQLAKDDPATYGQFANQPDYTSEAVTNSFAFASSFAIGDEVYLYGADILNASVSVNGKLWYEDDFVSNAYIIKGAKAGDDYYDPEKAVKKDVMYKLGINMLNGNAEEGAAMILSRTYGETLSAKNYDFKWWKTAVFDWNGECYECVSLSLVANGNAIKGSDIPENGFVYAVNTGNDYSANGGMNYTNGIATLAFSNIENITVGSKAYLSGIDLDKNSINTNGKLWYDPAFTSDAILYINVAPDGEKLYTPTVPAGRPDAVKEISLSETAEQFDFAWNASAGAEKYKISVYDSHEISDGKLIKSETVTECKYSIKRSDLAVGYTYTLRVVPVGNTEGMECRNEFYVYDASAATSPYRDKTVLAFGDSITAFTGWVGMLKSMLGTEVINAGVGGNTTNDAVARLERDVLDRKPDVVILNFGANDQAIVMATGQPNVSLEAYEKNLRTIIEACRNIGARVVMFSGHHPCAEPGYYVAGGYGLNYAVDGNIDKFIAVQKKLTEEYDIELIPITEYADEVGTNKICAPGDGLHLSNYGHQMYTKWIGEYLLANPGKTPETSTSDDTPSSPDESSEADTASEEASTTVSDNTEQPEKGGNALPLALAAVGVIAVAAIVAIAISKKKKK